MFSQPEMQIVVFLLPLAVVVMGQMAYGILDQIHFLFRHLSKFNSGWKWHWVFLNFPFLEHVNVFTQHWLRNHRWFGCCQCEKCWFFIGEECDIQVIVFLEECVELNLCIVYATKTRKIDMEWVLITLYEAVQRLLHFLKESHIFHSEVDESWRVIDSFLLVEHTKSLQILTCFVALDVFLYFYIGAPALHQFDSVTTLTLHWYLSTAWYVSA